MKRIILLVFLFATFGCKAQIEIHIELFDILLSYNPPTVFRYAQGMDIFDGKVFQSFSDGTIDIFDLSSRNLIQKIGPLKNEKGEVLHMNDISFMQVNGNTFLVIPNNGINNPLCVYPINKNGLYYVLGERLLVPVPKLDDTIYRASTVFLGNGNKCIQVAYERTKEDGFGDITVEAYYFDELSLNTTYQKKWSIKHERLWAMQGAVINNGCCYMAVGVGNGDAKIYKIDYINGNIVCMVDFRKDDKDLLPNEEMQGVAYYNKEMYFSTTYGLYKLL